MSCSNRKLSLFSVVAPRATKMIGVFCFLVISLNTSITGKAYASDMQAAINHALDAHPSLRSARAEEKAALHEKQIEQSYLYPEIKIKGEGGRIFQDNATSRGFNVTRGNAYSAYGLGSVALYQTLYDGSEIKNRVAAADLRKQALTHNFQDIELNLVLGVAQNYLDIKRIRAALNILDHQEKIVKNYRDRIREMVESGGADESEVQQALDVQMVVQTSRADYEGQRLAARASFRELTGKDPVDDLAEPRTLSAIIPLDADTAIEQAKTSHPLLMSAQKQVEASQSDVDAEKAQIYPDLNGELSYLRSDKREVIGGDVTDARAIVKLDWNFSTGNRIGASVDRRMEERALAIARQEQTVKQLERDIRQAYATYNTFVKKRDIAAERVKLNKDLLKTYEMQFEGSRISLLTLMRAQSQLFSAMIEYSDNDHFVTGSEYNILAMTGALKPALLSAENNTQFSSGAP